MEAPRKQDLLGCPVSGKQRGLVSFTPGPRLHRCVRHSNHYCSTVGATFPILLPTSLTANTDVHQENGLQQVPE